MTRDILPTFTACDAADIVEYCSFLRDTDWLQRCHCFTDTTWHHSTKDTSTTATPFMMCCLQGRYRVCGMRDGQVQQLALRPGEGVLWMPGCWVQADDDSPDSLRLRLNIAPDYRLLAMRRRRRGRSGALLARLQPGPRSALQEQLLAGGTAGDDTRALQLLRCLLDDVTRECLRPLPGADRARATFLAICHQLQDNAQLAPDRSTVAQALGIHVGHVSRLVTRFAHCSYSQLLQRYQLQLAMPLLRDHADDIGRVATLSGFSSSTYFIRIFKAAQGCTPGQWRTAQQAASASAVSRK